jgi:hypothetical protein
MATGHMDMGTQLELALTKKLLSVHNHVAGRCTEYYTSSSKYLHGGVAVGESVNMRGTGFEVCHLCQQMEASID